MKHILAAAALAMGLAAVPAVAQAVQTASQDRLNLETDASGQDIIPALFHGRWATSASACRDIDGHGVVSVSRMSVEDSGTRYRLIKHAGISTRAAISGRDASTLTMLVAQSGEGRVGFARLALGLTAGKLYLIVPTDPVEQSGGRVRLDDATPGLVRCG